MTLQVIGAGLPRTGTNSLRRALDMLGFGRCYHMAELMRRPQDAEIWVDALETRSLDWGASFPRYRATMDTPGCILYKELLARSPHAKVVLSVRDAEGWFKSISATILNKDAMQKVPAHMPAVFRAIRGHLRLNDDREAMVAMFHSHTEQVKADVPAEQLLVYDVREGWEPLCAFLGVPVPDKPFPQTNTSNDFYWRYPAMRRVILPLAAVFGAPVRWLEEARRRTASRADII